MKALRVVYGETLARLGAEIPESEDVVRRALGQDAGAAAEGR